MKRIGLLALLTAVLVFSCGTGPAAPAETPPPPAQAEAAPSLPPPPVAVAPPPALEPPPEPAPVPAETAPEAPEPEAAFDPASITEEKRESARTDIRALIGDLNRIIRAKDYRGWVDSLSESYFEAISSREFLDERTEDLYKRDQTVASNLGRDPRRVSKKILRAPKDYFDHVVVPSRSNDRMDDIDFVSENRVKAYTLDSRGQRLVLYDLELIDGKWKIIN